ncbi:hypothetical protein GF358_02625 [Candidatus Woesearchaeota archaeon]|nr:hypothetical protein [Candidatus Woesearchaeota archaeon]
MNIPAIVWLMLGTILSVFSYYLGKDFILFFYSGIIIIALGIFKITLQYIFSEKASKTEKQKISQQEHYTSCRHCNNIVRKIDYYCSMCGKQLR